MEKSRDEINAERFARAKAAKEATVGADRSTLKYVLCGLKAYAERIEPLPNKGLSNFAGVVVGPRLEPDHFEESEHESDFDAWCKEWRSIEKPSAPQNLMAATDQVDHTAPEPKPSHIVTIKTQHGEFEQNSHVHEPGWHPCHNQGRQVWWQLDEAGYHIHTGNPNEVRVVGDWAVVQNYLDTGNW